MDMMNDYELRLDDELENLRSYHIGNIRSDGMIESFPSFVRFNKTSCIISKLNLLIDEVNKIKKELKL